jgi:hypothetical protein
LSGTRREIARIRDRDRFKHAAARVRMCRVHDNRVRTHRASVLIDHQKGVVLIQIAVRNRDRAEFAIRLRRHRRECFDRAIGRPRRDVLGDNA